MDYKLYLILTLGLYACEMFVGCTIKSIQTPMNFLAPVAGSSLAFFFPGVFTLKAISLYEHREQNKNVTNAEKQNLKLWAYIYNTMGLISFVLLMFVAIYDVINPDASSGE